MLIHFVKAHARLRDVSLDRTACSLKLTGTSASLARAAQILNTSLQPSPSPTVQGLTQGASLQLDANKALSALPYASARQRAQCLVCLDSTHTLDRPLIELLCGHKWHPDCLKESHKFRAVESKHEGRKEPIRCPAGAALQGAGGCMHVLTPAEVCQVFGSGAPVLEHFQAQVDQKLRVHPDARSCTQCGALAFAIPGGLPLTCGACGTSFCGSKNGRCCKRAHYYSSCSQFAEARASKRRRSGDSTAMQELLPSDMSAAAWPADVVLCGRCRCPIVRDQGINASCKYMRCKFCAHEFCWLCLQPADDHKHIDPSDPRQIPGPECDNPDGLNPSAREERRLAIIEGGSTDATPVPLPRGQVSCDRCGTQEGLHKVFACLECLNSFLCEACEPSGCVHDPMHTVDTIELQKVAEEATTLYKEERSRENPEIPLIPEGFWSGFVVDAKQTSSSFLRRSPPTHGAAPNGKVDKEWRLVEALGLVP